MYSSWQNRLKTVRISFFSGPLNLILLLATASGAVLIGTLSSIYPVIRAAKLDPSGCALHLRRMQVTLILIENVSKTYNQTDSDPAVPVLSGINAEIEEGEFIALMGPSGSGKSTLLTILGAMNHPSTGKVLIDGIDVYGLPDERRADFRMEYLGFVFQQHHLMPYLTALENVMLLLTSRP
jgi:ABC-type bacteriocin/lantibiotic exporter with double-glycine peptidase domain